MAFHCIYVNTVIKSEYLHLTDLLSLQWRKVMFATPSMPFLTFEQNAIGKNFG